jgi:hypothetical protein
MSYTFIKLALLSTLAFTAGGCAETTAQDDENEADLTRKQETLTCSSSTGAKPTMFVFTKCSSFLRSCEGNGAFIEAAPAGPSAYTLPGINPNHPLVVSNEQELQSTSTVQHFGGRVGGSYADNSPGYDLALKKENGGFSATFKTIKFKGNSGSLDPETRKFTTLSQVSLKCGKVVTAK